MSTLARIARLQALGVKLLLQDGKLKLNAPKGVLTDALMSELKQYKAEITQFLENLQLSQPDRIPRTDRGKPLPLSFAQQRLWFLDQLEGPSATYNMPIALSLRGALDVAALERCLQAIVNRHESLRTTFLEQGGDAIQHVSEHLDLCIVKDTVAADQVAERVRTFALRPFDLRVGPLVSVLLLQVAAEEHVMVLNMHHIISDGWSIGVMVREFAALYAAETSGEKAALPALPIQYPDFAVWQRERLQGERFQQQLDYWVGALRGMTPLLELPTDAPRPPVQSFHGDTVEFSLGVELSAALLALSRRENASLYMTMLAAFHVLMARYSGQTDIAIGSPIANRTLPELEGLIGFFVNTLVLRASVDPDMSFREFLTQVRQTTLGAFNHQDLPFEQLVEAVSPARSLSHTPLFQVAFALQNMEIGELQLPGLVVGEWRVDGALAKFDLQLDLKETTAGLEGQIVYSTALFERTTIERMVEHYRELLNAIAEDAAVAIGDLRLMPDGERTRVLDEWNRTDRDFPRDASLAELFVAQAQRTPAAVAVESGEQALTYAELEAQSRSWADWLNGQGIGPGQRVGLAIERSCDLLVGLLAIVRTGASYVPLDRNYPLERLAMMATDANLALILTDRNAVAALSTIGRPMACIDEAIDPAVHASLPVHIDAGSEAYVLYTSGSTGMPKGVSISQRAVSRLVFNPSCAQLQTGQRVAQVASIAFDAATFELWAPLLQGGTVVIIDRDTVLDPSRLKAALHGKRIDCALLTTGVFNLTAQNEPDAFAGLDTVIFGGEAADVSAISSVLASGAPRRLVNAYGPTECTTYATWHEVGEHIGNAVVPIGKPLFNTRVYVLDQRRQPVPIGVAGELYLGGAGVADGYINRPDLTAERFIASPFVAGDRLYRTGDLVRWDTRGRLLFLGRVDQQVKIRGFRIELGEVEAALLQLPEVKEAAVLALADQSGAKRLVAYVAGPPETAGAVLREALRQRLPDYMLPALVMVLQQLPLTVNGKLDRKALPHPSFTNVDAFVAPRNETERDLVAIFADVLKLEQVSVHDNFFDIGGHSLLAMQVIARIRERFAVQLEVRSLFESPVIATLATMIDTAVPVQQGAWTPLVQLSQGLQQAPKLFLVHAQAGTIVSYAPLARALGDTASVYALQAEGLLEGQQPCEDIQEMASSYLSAMREVQAHGPYHLAGWSMGGLIAVEMAQQLQAHGESVAMLGLIDAPGPRNRCVQTRSRASLLVDLWGNALGFTEDDLAPLSGLAQIEMVLLRAQGAGLVPRAFTVADAERQLRVIEAHAVAVMRHVPASYSGPAVLFQAEKSVEIGFTDGWEACVTGGVAAYTLPGDHNGIVEPAQSAQLALLIRKHLDAANQKPAPVQEATCAA